MSVARTSGQDALTPAPKPKTPQTILVEVNSRDRNYSTANQTTNSFRFIFQRPIKDIQTVELLAGTVPVPYAITSSNNAFTVIEGTARNTITLTPAFYTNATLAAALQTALNAMPAKANTYTAALESTGTYLIVSRVTGTAPFTFLFATGSPADTGQAVNTPSTALGFSTADYTHVNGVIQAPFPMEPFVSRIYLYIDFESTLSLSAIERGAGRRSPFGILYFDQTTNGYKFLNKETIQQTLYKLAHPLPRLQSLQIDFRDEFYHPVNFGGRELTLLLQFIGLVA
jgi:hypothetical protein